MKYCLTLIFLCSFLVGKAQTFVVENNSISGTLNQNVRQSPSTDISSTILDRVKLDDFSVVSQVVTGGTFNGGDRWGKVDIPSTTSATSGYVALGVPCMLPYCTKSYVKITTTSINIRTGAGTGNPQVTISGLPAKVFSGQHFALVSTSGTINGNFEWHQIYLTMNCSQTTGWIATRQISPAQTWATINSSATQVLDAPILNPATNITANSADISATNNINYYWRNYDFNVNGNIQTGSYTGAAATPVPVTDNKNLSGLSSGTTYNVFTIEKNNAGCYSAQSNTIIFTTTGGGGGCTTPSVTASATPTVVNTGGILQLTATPSQVGTYTYVWTGPNGFTSILQNPPPINNFTASMAGSYCVTMTQQGCTPSQDCRPVSYSSGCVSSIAPTSITPNSPTIQSGNPITLTVANGTLGTGATWKWYSGSSCGGTYVGSGSQISVSPTTTTTYWVRAEGGSCSNTTTCASVVVNVATQNCNLATPTGLNATAVSSSQINLTWNLVPNATGYDVYFCDGTYIKYTATPPLQVTGLTANTLYSFKVSAQLNNGGIVCSSLQTLCKDATTTNNLPSTTLKVNILPASIVNQAKWSIDGGVTKHNNGETIIVTAGATYKVRFSGVNYYNCPPMQDVTVTAGTNNIISATYTKGPLQLSFPLYGKNPYTIKITSVCDHSRPTNEIYEQSDNKVVAYTGEIGDVTESYDLHCKTCTQGIYPAFSSKNCLRCIPWYGWSGASSFQVNGNYTGGNLLYYNGHPGYDYSTILPQSGLLDQNVYAAEDGITVTPFYGENCTSCNTSFGVVVIDHGNGFRTYYLHLKSIENNFKEPNVNKSRGEVSVRKGEIIGTVGGTSLESGTQSYDEHLHFEVRKFIASQNKWRYIDPYGWTGQFIGDGKDPYPYLNQNLWSEQSIYRDNQGKISHTVYGSKLPNCKIFLKDISGWQQFAETDEYGKCKIERLDPFILGDSIMFSAVGYDTLKTILNSENLVSGKIDLPMLKVAPTNKLEYPSVLLLGNKLTNSNSAQFKIFSKNLVGYDVITYGGTTEDSIIYTPYSVAASIYTMNLDTGYNDLQIRMYSNTDTLFFTRSVYYYPSNILTANSNKLFINAANQYINSEVYVDNEYYATVNNVSFNIPIAKESRKVNFYKKGYYNLNPLIISSDTTISIGNYLLPINYSSTSDSSIHDFYNGLNPQYWRTITTKNMLKGGNTQVSVKQYDDNFANMGLLPQTRKFVFRNLSSPQPTLLKTAIALDQIVTPDSANVYLLNIKKGNQYFKFLPNTNGICEYDPEVQKIAFDNLNFINNAATEELVLMKKQAPLINNKVIEMYCGETKDFPISTFFNNPDSIKNDVLVYSSTNGVQIINGMVRILAPFDNTNPFKIKLAATHDFITLSNEFAIKLNAPLVFVPSSFTPNGDGRNDIFKPKFYGGPSSYHFVIYNRFGQKIFETNDYTNGWNGKINGINQTGTFVWVMEYQLGTMPKETKKGTVTLIR